MRPLAPMSVRTDVRAAGVYEGGARSGLAGAPDRPIELGDHIAVQGLLNILALELREPRADGLLERAHDLWLLVLFLVASLGGQPSGAQSSDRCRRRDFVVDVVVQDGRTVLVRDGADEKVGRRTAVVIGAHRCASSADAVGQALRSLRQ